MIGDNERDILKEFGKNLKKLREERDLSFREFSRLSGVNTGDIVKYENGESGPNILTLKKLAIGLKVHPTKLLDFNFKVDFNVGLE
ncbi:helix-turn-helix domain-containing protein [Pedobacter cryoconitis]|uniref:Transcriptional regulator with XRE-family HTH domain n=1 Tax=Pedobacter cryoconitis TaxID=188932 RepID=A0A7X0MHB8_9SPHI|nr:helix-turn-helix transcriptional regulator [Pedobacter cryoconitis]MBB6498964.1 transcriptional regulator with XRE-family HTH domain [Pedobacter cryoconitis]